jgi:hypothetical protein
MKAAGILGKYRLGVVDDATLAAFKTVLGQANRTASDWTVGLKALQSGATGGPGLTYRVSNPDDLNKVIEQSAKYVLGRSIDPAMSQRIAKAYQQLQIEEQRANQRGAYKHKPHKQTCSPHNKLNRNLVQKQTHTSSLNMRKLF